MVTAKLVLRKKKRYLENMNIPKLQEILNSKQNELKSIKKHKKLYNGCYVNENGNLLFTKALMQEIILIKAILHKKSCELGQENY